MCTDNVEAERKFMDDPNYNIPDEYDCSPDTDERTEEMEPNGSRGTQNHNSTP